MPAKTETQRSSYLYITADPTTVNKPSFVFRYSALKAALNPVFSMFGKNLQNKMTTSYSQIRTVLYEVGGHFSFSQDFTFVK